MKVKSGPYSPMYIRAGKLIAKVRDGLGLTQEQLAAKLGHSNRQRLQNWEVGKAMPRPNEMRQLCEELGISEQQLLNGDDSLARDVAAVAEDDQGLGEHGIVRKVPVISWVAASQFSGSGDPFPPGAAEEWIYVVNVSDKCFALRVRGSSMEPRFLEGDLIVLDPGRSPKPGDFIVVVREEEQATFKQLVIDDGVRWLKPLNPQYPAFKLPMDARICGVVVRKIEEF